MRSLVTLSLLLFAGLASAQTFTLTPASGSGPRTATWNVPNGTNCQASGAPQWTGSKAASGTQQIVLPVGTHSLGFTCTVPGATTKGGAILEWVAPTTNTDGSALTNLKGYSIHYGRTAAALSNTLSVNDASATTRSIDNLDAGAWFFGIRAINTNDVQSELSNIATKNVTDQTSTTTWTGTQTTTVTESKPGAPVLTVR